MVLENLVIPFQINNKIKGTIVRLSSVASQIINNEYPRNINSIFADSISITASIGSRMKNDGVFSFQAHSEGVIKTIFVDLNNNSSVRGYMSVNHLENIENLPFENNKFDCILIDAPCSGSGLMQKKPEILVTEKKIDPLLRKQKNMLKC
mgnify:CR=1 FL=1